MAEVTLTLRFNPSTGQREIVVGYEGDLDALPHEHERDHRALVASLLGASIDDETAVIVRRVRKDGTVIEAPAPEVVGRTPERSGVGR